jgi:hypothetical protein
VKSWTVHLHPERPPELLREGFSWGAFCYGPLWLAAHRAWAAAVFALAGFLFIALRTHGLTLPVLWLAEAWLLGLWGNDLCRLSLAARGFSLAHVIAARDADGAFSRLLAVRPDLAETFHPAEPATRWWPRWGYSR